MVDCVVNDPRWDRQLEQRESYYATLLLELGTNIDPLESLALEVPREESDVWLCVDVLAQLAWRGRADAVAVVNRAIAEGPSWRQFLDALDALGGSALLKDVVLAQSIATLLERVGTDGFGDTARAVGGPWVEWAGKVPGLRFLLGGPESAPDSLGTMPLGRVLHRLAVGPVPSFDPKWPTAKLLEFAAEHGVTGGPIIRILSGRTGRRDHEVLAIAAEEGPAAERTIALRVLARQGNTEFITVAVEFQRTQSGLLPDERGKDALMRRAYSKYLEELPGGVSLPLAREWVLMPWPLSCIGEHVLADHATLDDRPLLERECERALEKKDMHRVCSLVEGLGTVADAASLPVLLAVHDGAPYSKARERVVSCLHRFPRSETTEGVLTDALWDCEDAIRADAAETVSLTLDARRRLAAMSRDVFEDDDVRDEARHRIG